MESQGDASQAGSSMAALPPATFWPCWCNDHSVLDWEQTSHHLLLCLTVKVSSVVSAALDPWVWSTYSSVSIWLMRPRQMQVIGMSRQTTCTSKQTSPPPRGAITLWGFPRLATLCFHFSQLLFLMLLSPFNPLMSTNIPYKENGGGGGWD